MAPSQFYKYGDSPTIYGGGNKAFSTPDEFFAAGGAKDFSNVESINGPTPAQLNPSTTLAGMKKDLNQFQTEQFASANPPPPSRQSSTLQDQITTENTSINDALAKFDTLNKQLETLKAPDLSSSYVQLRNDQGIPGLEAQYGSIDTQRNNLPYTTRASTSNAGVATESQLSDTTAQKDIPLYIQQKNIVDRLNLANEYVNTAIQLKGQDYDKSVQAITTAANLIGQTIQLGQSHLSNLSDQLTQQQQTQDKAKQFAYENQVSKPFYEIGGTVYRTSDGKAYSTPDQFFKDGGSADFGNVQHVDAVASQEASMVLSLANDYKDAGIMPGDSYLVALSKLPSSKIYQKQVKTTGTGSGVNSGPTLGSTSIVDPTTDAAVANIIATNPGEWGHAADAIDAQFGAGTAGKYDSWLTAVYQHGEDISSIYQPPADQQFTPYEASKLAYASNTIVSNYVKSGSYKVVSEGAPYLSRIQTAIQNPGSVSDVELLDSVTKLNTGGNQVTESQVNTILKGRSLSDSVNVWSNKLSSGGVLSNDQRTQLVDLANATYQHYLDTYQPIYDQATSQLEAAGIPQSYWTIPNWNKLIGSVPQSNNQSDTSPQDNNTNQASQGFWSNTMNWLFGE